MGTIREPGASGSESLIRSGNLTDAATPFVSANATLITDTTARAIKAAPGAGKRLLITGMTISNATAAETSDITIQDSAAGTPVILFGPAAITGIGVIHRDFSPPIITAANVAVNGKATAATGDATVTIWGFVDDG